MPCLCLRDPSNNRSPNTLFFETTGWAGSVCILTAYLHKREESTDFALNLAGSCCLLAICLKKKVYQPATINLIWSIGSVYKYIIADADKSPI